MDKDKEKEKRDLALFRFSIIAPLVNDSYESLSKNHFFREMATKEHVLPNGKSIKVSSSTIKKWFLSYTHGGFDALIPKARSDIGISRNLNSDAMAKIHELKAQFPYITGTLIYKKLIEQGYIKECKTSLPTVLRYIRENNLKRNQVAPVDRRAYEMEFANDCWQSDTSHGPVIKVDGYKKQTYLIVFIDDASRLILHGEFFFNDNAINMQIVFRKAISKYGVPKRIFVDNGGTYRNEQLSLICASLGVILIHTKIYSPQSKGKVERGFRTIKDNWMNGIDWNQYTSLNQLNNDFNVYISEQYTNNKHSSIKDTPKNRYMQDVSKIKFIALEELNRFFLHRVTRKVRTDSTIKLECRQFEVPFKYIGQKINIRYSPENLDKAFIFNINNEILDTIYPLKKVDNSKVKRSNIDYSKVNGGNSDV